MNKSKRSMYTAVSGMALTLINGLLSLIVTKIVISAYGSDFNGVNSTANQLINMLLIVEGGFTLATSVALFKPISEKDQSKINAIMSATHTTFIRIGTIFLVVGVLVSVGFTYVIKSNLSFMTIFLVLFMTVLSSGFALLYETKYRILLQTEQKDYLINIVKIITIFVSQIIVIIVVRYKMDMILVRFITSLAMVASSIWIAQLCKKNYPDLRFNEIPDFQSIKGTKDIFVAKFTGMIYKTAPIIFIAVTSGTVFASVYAVYNSIFLLLKSLLFALSNAPRMAMGHLIIEKGKDYVYEVFTEYEFIVNHSMLILLCSTAVLIMPFIGVYTYNITDVVYRNWFVAVFLLLATFFEVIHLPAGNMINMAGKFKIGRNIQLIAAGTLLVSLAVGYLTWGFEGVMFSILLTSVLLAAMEITIVYQNYFEKPVFDFILRLLPSTVFAFLLVYLELLFIPEISGYWEFFQWGVIITVLNSILFIAFSWVVYPKMTGKLFIRVKPLLKKLKIM